MRDYVLKAIFNYCHYFNLRCFNYKDNVQIIYAMDSSNYESKFFLFIACHSENNLVDGCSQIRPTGSD